MKFARLKVHLVTRLSKQSGTKLMNIAFAIFSVCQHQRGWSLTVSIVKQTYSSSCVESGNAKVVQSWPHDN